MLADVCLQERIFALCYLLMAYILAVVFISSMTSAMTRPGELRFSQALSSSKDRMRKLHAESCRRLYLITGIQAGHQRVLRWFLIDAWPCKGRASFLPCSQHS